MTGSIFEKVEFHNGVKMPVYGLGVYKVEEGQQIEATIHSALRLGYRLIDTASFYENEEGVGRAIKSSGIPRDDVFITTKVWNSDQGYESTLQAFDDSLNRLGTDYLDLYLVHWPVKDKYLETWRAMEHLYKQGKVRAIGVSNFQVHHLEDILEHAAEKPVINQVELHPLLSQEKLRDFCKTHEIKVEAWSPLGRGRFLGEPVLEKIARNHGKSPAQVILRWHYQNEIISIPKSVNPARLAENAAIFDFQLDLNEMNEINSLNRNQRFGADPDSFDF